MKDYIKFKVRTKNCTDFDGVETTEDSGENQSAEPRKLNNNSKGWGIKDNHVAV